MDPDVTLAEIREHVRIMNDKDVTPSTRATHGEWLQERVEQLDAYLSRGGFPPSAWNKPPTTTPFGANDRVLAGPEAVEYRRRRIDAIQRELEANPWERRP